MNYDPTKSIYGSPTLPPILQNVAIFGDGAFKE
jgi:hypothetical protein